MTTPTLPDGAPDSPEVPKTLNRIFTSKQVQENLALAEARYSEQYKFLDKTGLNGEPFMNPFTWDTDTESFQNVREQGSMVVFVATSIADKLKEKWVVSEAQYDEIINGAIAHNSLKRFEVFMKGTFPSLIPYSKEWIAELRTVIADKEGILTPEEFENAVRMRNTMWHGSLADFVTIKDGIVTINPERGISEMIVHIASDMVWAQNKKIKDQKWESHSSDIQVSSFLDRAVYADFELAYKFLFTEWLAVSEIQWVSIIKDTSSYKPTWGYERLENYYEWQKIVFELICRDLQKKISPIYAGDPVEFIVRAVNEVGAPRLIDDFAAQVDRQLPE